MLILALRTDNPEAELHLIDNQKVAQTITWHAHRKLAESLHSKIEELLKKENLSISDIDGVIIYEGPGSFTGLRIGISIANALAYSLGVPVLAVGGENWLTDGVRQFQNSEIQGWAQPKYGSPAHVTQPKH